MLIPRIGKALLTAGVVLVLTTGAIDYAQDAGWLTQKLVVGTEDYTAELRREEAGPLHRKTWDVRKYGYVAGTIGLCLLLVGAPKKEETPAA